MTDQVKKSQKKMCAGCGKKLTNQTILIHQTNPERCARAAKRLGNEITTNFGTEPPPPNVVSEPSRGTEEVTPGVQPFRPLSTCVDRSWYPPTITLREWIHLPSLRRILFNLELLSKIIFSNARQGTTKEERNSHISLLKKYYQIAKESEQKGDFALVEVRYRQKDGIGRYACDGMLGLQTITRVVRHTISGEKYFDVDVVNAHPCFLLWYCKTTDIPCKYLERYVNEREALMEEGQKKAPRYLPTRGAAKNLFLTALNGSPRKKIPWAFYHAFYTNCENIWKQVARLNPDRLELARNHRKPGWNAPDVARATNRICLDIENDVLVHMKRYFEFVDIPVDVLCYDGCQVKKKGLSRVALGQHLRKCEKHVLEKLGVPIHLKEKKMDEGIDSKTMQELDDAVYVDDQDKFMTIRNKTVKQRTDAETRFYKEYKRNIATENVKDFYDLDTNKWIFHRSRDLVQIRADMTILVSQPLSLCVKAAMGLGKTTSLTEALCTLPRYSSIVALSPRITFAQTFTARLSRDTPYQFDSYLEREKGYILDSPFVVDSGESLHRIENVEERKGGLLIIDECESFYSQLTSYKTHGKNHRVNIETFTKLVRNASRVVCLDAFLSNKTLKVMNAHGIQTQNHNFTFKNERRKALRVPLGKKQSTLPFLSHLIGNLKSGKKIFLVCSSKTKLVSDFLPAALDAIDEAVPGTKVLQYHSDLKSTDLASVKKDWASADLVACTTSLTVGVDFDLERFDLLYVFASAASQNIIRDLFQASYRVRKIKEKKMVYCLNPCPYNLYAKYPLSRWQIRKKLISMEGSVARLYGSAYQACPDWLLELQIDNHLEASLSVMNQEVVFDRFLKECNYSKDDALLPPPSEVSVMPPVTHIPYSNVRRLNSREVDLIRKRKERGENLSEEERAAYQFFFYRECVDSRKDVLEQYTPESTAQLILDFAGPLPSWRSSDGLWAFWCSSDKGEKFRQLRSERKMFEGESAHEYRENRFGRGNLLPVKTILIHRICTALGIDHTQKTGTVIPRSRILKFAEDLSTSVENPLLGKHESLLATIVSVFEVRDENRSAKKKEYDVKKTVGLLNQVLGRWGCTYLLMGERKRERRDGKRVYVTPVTLLHNPKFPPIWSSLRTPKTGAKRWSCYYHRRVAKRMLC